MDESATRRPRDLAAIAVAMALPTVITWLYFFAAAGAAAKTQLAVFKVVKVIQFALPAFWVMAIQRERLFRRGWQRGSSTGAAAGLAFGCVVAAATLGLYFAWLRTSPELAAASSQIAAKLRGFAIDRPWKYITLGVFYSLVHSLLEEYYWRWFVFGQLRGWIGAWPAVAVSAVGFMAHHVLVLGKFFGFASPVTWLLSACVAVGGAAWAWFYHRSGSLVGPWLSHMMVDAAIFAAGFDVARDYFLP